ncbi:MAG: hypothetical protein VSS75_031670, partial [Candidatus Parabeggiatoa sp.]|nr:hypothetical protein [Candidatus Parabeggiatoa sp.]
DVLNEPNAWDSLDQIVYHFITGRHLWDITDLAEIEKSNWIQEDIQGRSGKRNLETLQKYYTDSIYPRESRESNLHTITLIITQQVSGESNKTLTPDDAVYCLNKPAYVVVENQTSDGAFLDAMIHAFGRTELRDAQTEGWWEYLHLGGFGEIEKRVEDIRTHTLVGPLRVFVLTDSDRCYPGEVTKTIKKVTEYCDKVGDVPYAILQKRKIENYLPISALWSKAVPKKWKNIYQAFLSLIPEQQAHYEMKKGFKKENDHAIISGPDEHKKLFKHVPQHILDNLCGGFGDTAWAYFKSKRDMITEEAIRLTCTNDPNEIVRILDSIEGLL